MTDSSETRWVYSPGYGLPTPKHAPCVHGCKLPPDHKDGCLSDTPHRFGPAGCDHCDVADSSERDERREKYSVAEIREAYALFASKDDWGVPAFYDTGLIAALRGEYDDEDTNRKRMILRLGGTL